MIAIREIKKPINQQIIIDLPDDFKAKKVDDFREYLIKSILKSFHFKEPASLT